MDKERRQELKEYFLRMAEGADTMKKDEIIKELEEVKHLIEKNKDILEY